MTVNQALEVANVCSILYNSKQINFGLANKFAKNSKVYNVIMLEVQEIRQRGEERKETEEVVLAELTEFGKKDFTGTFETIAIESVESLTFEEIPVKDGKSARISDLLVFLQELEIIK